MITVKATREGLAGGKTASGYIIDSIVSFCALPTPHALGKHVRITNPANGKSCIAQVLDVGPWNIKDSNYVFQQLTSSTRDYLAQASDGFPTIEVRPQAESGIDLYGRKTNGAGIDLGENVWKALGMTDNGLVSWEFIE